MIDDCLKIFTCEMIINTLSHMLDYHFYQCLKFPRTIAIYIIKVVTFTNR